MTAYDLVKKPVITEKTEILRRDYNKYTFEVSPQPNKVEIRNAIETIFNVKVEYVATINVKPVTK
ncbi:50S ribosomal protein L23, partial [Cetobacterium somerae]|uniref:50S ribosomal protein L23 n=1 Tax=Cetobacterium somerae TaxID=188913 RepID=UPI00211EFC07